MNHANVPSALDAEVAERLRSVSTATLTMVLVKQGVRTSWLRGPKPLEPVGTRIVGPAFTIRFVPGREDLSGPESYARSPSFRDAIEAAPAGSVVVIDGCGNPCGATLGDILVARLARKGVVAAVTDAQIRAAYEHLARAEGVFAEPAAAASVAGLLALHDRGVELAGRQVVCVISGAGLKDPEAALQIQPDRRDVPATLAGIEAALD